MRRRTTRSPGEKSRTTKEVPQRVDVGTIDAHAQVYALGHPVVADAVSTRADRAEQLTRAHTVTFAQFAHHRLN